MRLPVAALLSLVLGVGASKPAHAAESEAGELSREILSIEQQARALDLVRGRFLIAARKSDARTPERARTTLWEARTHLLLGDPARALQVATHAQNEASAGPLRLQFLKIRFESERKLGRLKEATESCQRFLILGARDEAWFLSCAHLLARRARGEPEAVLGTLATWATAPALRRGNPFLIPTSLLLATALENGGSRAEARSLLARTLVHAEKNDAWLPRARYAKALFDLHQGEEAEGLLTLRELAKAPVPREAAEQPTDVATMTLAQVALARWYEGRSNSSEADKFFKNALAALSRNPSPRADSGGRAGIIAPSKVLALAPENSLIVDVVAFRSEYASHLCAKGAIDACAHELDAISEDLPERSVAEALARSKAMRAQGMQRLARMTGYAQADVAFVEKQRELPIPLGIDELSARAAALLTIAQTYGHQGERLQVLAELESIPRRLRASTLQAREGLAAVLMPAEAFLDGQKFSGSQMALRTLDGLSHRLWSVVRDLDALSSQAWRNGAGNQTPRKTRDALLARAGAIFDATSRRMAAWNAAPARDALAVLGRDIVRTQHEMGLNRARAASLGVLLDLTKKESERDRWWRDAQRGRFDALATLDHDLAGFSSALLDHRLTLLQASFPTEESLFREKSLPRAQKTLEDLAALHVRQASSQDAGLADLWKRAVNAHKSIVDGAAEFRRFDLAERKLLAGEAQNVLRDFETLERRSLVLAESYRKELQALIPQVARELAPPVARFREELRLALADVDGDALREAEEARRLLEKAAQERKTWIEALRETLRWGLAR